MSIRLALCLFVVAALTVEAWRGRWFRSLCGALVLMAFLEHPDMPRMIFGIPGFNLWNFLYVNIMVVWLRTRAEEGLDGDAPKALRVAFWLYLAVMVSAFLRLLINPTPYFMGTTGEILMDYLINPLKFLLPGLMLYDGCRTRKRVLWAVSALLLAYFLLSIQVINYMGLHFDSGEALSRRAAKILRTSVGYHRVDMSTMLAGASWAFIAFSRLVDNRMLRWGLWGGSGVILLAQALTGGRTGYLTWGLVGLVFAVLKWRKLILFLPVVVILVFTFIPSVRERMLAGFGEADGPETDEENMSEITSGRSAIWPHVIEKIKESPIIGYGRIAMVRTGLFEWLLREMGEEFRHPHNAYLEMLLDNGLVGFLCVIPLYYMVFRRANSLFLDRSDPLFEAAGGVALALLLALLVGSLGAQTLYPREGVVGMWAAIGIALRVWMERERMLDGEESGMASEEWAREDHEFADENPDSDPDDESAPSSAT